MRFARVDRRLLQRGPVARKILGSWEFNSSQLMSGLSFGRSINERKCIKSLRETFAFYRIARETSNSNISVLGNASTRQMSSNLCRTLRIT